MKLSRHSCQSPGEPGAKAALHLPALAFLTSIAVLQTPTTHNTLGVLYFSHPNYLSWRTPGFTLLFFNLCLSKPCPVDSLPSLPDTDVALVPLQPSTQGAEFIFYSSEHIGHRFGKSLEPAVGSCGRLHVP